MEDPINLETDDCLPFRDDGNNGAIKHFVTKASNVDVIRFTEQDENRPIIAHLNYQNGRWRAGRLVGEAFFNYNDQKYKIKINPRFGDKHLIRMIEEIFNIRLTESKQLYDRSKKSHQLIKRLISILWLNLLAKGNRHGLPRVSDTKTYYGTKVRGRINVRDSLIPVKIEQKIVSFYKQKTFDKRIVKLLKGAYEILLTAYHLATIRQPQNAKYALDQLNRIDIPLKRVTKHEYKNIRVKRIYKPFEPVIDLSWDIIKNRRSSKQQVGKDKSFSYFVDMAEVWELYLSSLLKKHLSQYGWSLWEEDIESYHDKLFERRLIPDIVLQKDKKIIVLDAKYKRMKFDRIDIDRADYFQIHTYIQYFQQEYDVIAGGLLYPFSAAFHENRQNMSKSESLFGQNSERTKFFIDGIDLTDYGEDNFDFTQVEQNFLERLKSTIVI